MVRAGEEKGYIRLINAKGETIGMTKNWQIPPDACDYIIYREGDYIIAKNGKAGEEEFKDTDWGKIVNSIVSKTGGNVTIFTKNNGSEYTFSTPVEFTADKVKLLSDGAVVRWTIQDTSTIPIKIYGNDLEIAGFDFRGMYWAGIYVNYMTLTKYSGIKIHDNKFSGWGGLEGGFSIGAYVTVAGCDDVWIYRNYFDINDDAVQVTRGNGFDCENVYIYDNIIKNSCIEVGGWSIDVESYIKNVTVSNNKLLTENYRAYIRVSTGIKNVEICNNKIVNNTDTIESAGVYVYNNNYGQTHDIKIENVSIHDNYIKHYGIVAVEVAAEEYRSVRNVKIYNNTFAGTLNASSIIIEANGTVDNVEIYNNKMAYDNYIVDIRALETRGSGVLGRVILRHNELQFLSSSSYKGFRIALTPSELSVYGNTYTDENGNKYFDEYSLTAKFSGDGTTTTFNVPHKVLTPPYHPLMASDLVAHITPMTADAAADAYVSEISDTYVTITFKNAPPSGTDNVKFYVTVKRRTVW
ncbi:MAG: hypothetical protein J7L14_00205 [Candidatus Diapherotrites archaeon]|nr:hypothetical protein [Candidatus Diapherotrites archaeon]